jgi:hypothetical protein
LQSALNGRSKGEGRPVARSAACSILMLHAVFLPQLVSILVLVYHLSSYEWCWRKEFAQNGPLERVGFLLSGEPHIRFALRKDL